MLKRKNNLYYFWSQDKKEKKCKLWMKLNLQERNKYVGLHLINFLKKDDLLSEISYYIRIYVIYFNYIVVFNVKRHVTI